MSRAVPLGRRPPAQGPPALLTPSVRPERSPPRACEGRTGKGLHLEERQADVAARQQVGGEAEQAALRYTEALTRAADTDADQAFQRFHDRLAEHFDAEEILEIIGVVVNMNVWTRLKLAEGAMPSS